MAAFPSFAVTSAKMTANVSPNPPGQLYCHTVIIMSCITGNSDQLYDTILIGAITLVNETREIRHDRKI